MAPLTGPVLAVLLGLAASPQPDPIARWSIEIDAAAIRCGVPREWIARVMQAESGGRTTLRGKPIRSPKGAIGLMQLMPATWTELRRELELGDDPDLPRDNIVAGACYLRRMYDRFGYPGLFAAYNAGPARYAAWLAGDARLPAETVAYLGSTGHAGALAHPLPMRRSAPLFVLRRAPPEAAPSSPDPSGGVTIFVLRGPVS